MPKRVAPQLLFSGFLLLFACRERAPLRIGGVLDPDGLRGAVMAADDLDAGGGINGRRPEPRGVNGLPSTPGKGALTAAERPPTEATILPCGGTPRRKAS